MHGKKFVLYALVLYENLIRKSRCYWYMSLVYLSNHACATLDEVDEVIISMWYIHTTRTTCDTWYKVLIFVQVWPQVKVQTQVLALLMVHTPYLCSACAASAHAVASQLVRHHDLLYKCSHHYLSVAYQLQAWLVQWSLSVEAEFCIKCPKHPWSRIPRSRDDSIRNPCCSNCIPITALCTNMTSRVWQSAAWPSNKPIRGGPMHGFCRYWKLSSYKIKSPTLNF